MTVLVPLYPASTLWLEQGIVDSIDISSFELDDFITIALPDFPASDLDLANTSVTFTSHEAGNFGAGPSVSVNFDQSETALIDGDSEFRFQISELDGIDLSSITGIRFRLEATTGGADFRVLSIRAISKRWVYAPIDFNTLNKRAYRPVTLNGSSSSTYDPIFSPWPNLFRAATFASEQDPNPIDAKLALTFNPGSQTDENRISLYFRERSLDYETQLDLDGVLSSELDGEPQPDWGTANYISRQQIDLDGIADSVPGSAVDADAVVGFGLTQADLNNVTQHELERKADPLTAAWIEVRITWNGTDSTIAIFDAETASPFYSFDITLEDTTQYVVFADLEDTSMRIRLYERDANILGTKVFDSTLMDDPEVFKRRKGRIGWSAELIDGDAYIENIDPRYLNFAEYQSVPYASLTPVTGASLDVGATEPSNLFKGFNPGPWGGTIYDDTERGTESFLIRNTATKPLQGIQTNFIYLDDLEHSKIKFDLFVSQDALDLGSIQAFFWDGSRALGFPLPPLRGGVWNSVTINLQQFVDHLLPNHYSIAIVQTILGHPNDWKIDGFRFIRTNIEWAGRAYTDDPWDLLNDTWINFDETVNKSLSGINFTARSNKFQIRAKALRQNAKVAQIYATPKYAELGRVTFDDRPIVHEQQVEFTSLVSGSRVQFEAQILDDDTNIIRYIWSFGDGTQGIGKTISHTYVEDGTYPVTIHAYMSNGEVISYTDDVVIS